MRKRVILTAVAAVLFVTGCGGMNASLTPVGKSQATVANQTKTTPAKLELKPKHVQEIATWEEVHYVETMKYAQPSTGDEGGGLQRPSSLTCGRETNRQGYDAKARDCLWQGYSAGKAVTFVTTLFTEEGDPITYEVEVRPPQIRVLVDSKDKFGKEGQFQYICTNMERSSYKPVDTHAPDWQEAKYGFLLRGCTGSETPEVYIP